MKTVQLRRLTESACDGPFGSAIKTEHYASDGARVVRLGNIGSAQWRDNDSVRLAMPYFESLYRHNVEPGDLLIAGLGDERNPVGRAAEAPVGLGPALVKADCYRFRLAGADARFIAYFLSSEFGIAQSAQLADGSTRKRLTLGKALGLRVPEVPLAEQRAIADYLDAETARIDALITKKQQLIHLLEERAQAALLRAVGDWRTGASRTLRQYGTDVLTGPFGTVLSASEYVEGGIPLVNPTHIREGGIVPEVGVSVPEAVAKRISRHRLSNGDLVMGRKGDVGRSAIVSDHESGWVCGSDSIAIRCGVDLLPNFLASVLRIKLYRQQLARTSTGAMVLNVNEGTLLALVLPDLTKAEQLMVADRAQNVLEHRAATLRRLERHVLLLRERRQALITVAVTGEFSIPAVA